MLSEWAADLLEDVDRVVEQKREEFEQSDEFIQYMEDLEYREERCRKKTIIENIGKIGKRIRKGNRHWEKKPKGTYAAIVAKRIAEREVIQKNNHKPFSKDIFTKNPHDLDRRAMKVFVLRRDLIG